jgi:hypothetical protein
MSPKPYALSLSAVLVAGLWCASASAADMRLKPGLWEMTMQSTQDGAVQQMPKLTPQQQAQMEKMGIKMHSGGNSMKIQTCLTKEQVERNEPPKPRDDARQKCEQTDLKRAGNTVSWKMACTGERPMTGSGSMTMQSPEAYSSSMNIVSTDPKHGPMTMSNNTQGRWLGADCPKK